LCLLSRKMQHASRRRSSSSWVGLSSMLQMLGVLRGQMWRAAMTMQRQPRVLAVIFRPCTWLLGKVR
jgi:hypothetical protein